MSDIILTFPSGTVFTGLKYYATTGPLSKVKKPRMPRKLKKKLKKDEQSRMFWRKFFDKLNLQEMASLYVDSWKIT